MQANIFTGFDLPHLGALCKHLRESRNVLLKAVAQACDVEESTITKFEQNGTTSRKTFNQYAKFIGSNHPPLKPHQQQLLTHLFENRRLVRTLECELTVLSFDDIVSERRRPAGLTSLLNQLHNETRPAYIMDSLWFIHAVNGALLELFDVTPDSDLLKRWEGWHVVAPKFYNNSPIRPIYANTNEFLPPTLVYFFQYESTYRFLFTLQMRKLIERMLKESADHHLEFHQWWKQVTSFTLPYNSEPMNRTFVYRQKRIQVEPKIVKTQDVRLGSGHPARYILSAWEPWDAEAKDIFRQFQTLKDKREIYYAADYEQKYSQKFHVNDWDEIKSASETWLCE